VDVARLDATSVKLLAILFRRWGERLSNAELYGQAYLAYTSIWRRNQKRFLTALSISRDLGKRNIDCMLIKGLALTLAHHGDYGTRSMEDVDVLIRPADLAEALGALEHSGWKTEASMPAGEIARQSRIRHAWGLTRGDEENCDVHWHPVLRCFSPRVADLFWRDARTVELFGRALKIPCATDLLFHACAHGLQWSWTPQIRWIPDALTLLRSAIDWERLVTLAGEAGMNLRLYYALAYLRERFGSQVPPEISERLRARGLERGEQREYELLQKPCPLGLFDRGRWHWTYFQRIREFDPEWRAQPISGFLHYLILFSKFQGSDPLK